MYRKRSLRGKAWDTLLSSYEFYIEFSTFEKRLVAFSDVIIFQIIDFTRIIILRIDFQ